MCGTGRQQRSVMEILTLFRPFPGQPCGRVSRDAPPPLFADTLLPMLDQDDFHHDRDIRGAPRQGFALAVPKLMARREDFCLGTEL